ncbi:MULTISPECIES: aminotransferase [unclassified Rhizobium]|uniref:aminotransferase n=1 Tax=unclassified Rhizobium TaxID=2613769 RepID=UPI000713D761|nr:MULTISPECIES: aminotransferase [unclassified Rhizobium]KQS89451.1 aminotransferase [Rhizobium sp. Leaf391]KQS94730.1 aminotransferase [Rhizobium sp. Leaf386]KQU01108.1 aminotransferase [Rhizobium sp. Leaf453]
MVNSVFGAAGTSIFEEMSRLSAEAGSINLGQGFPEALEPEELIEAAVAALREGPHQYPPMMGIPALRKAVADNTLRFFGERVDWEQEVLVTSGATEALTDAFFGLLDTGDEAIVLEPVYDAYNLLIRRAAAVPVPVRLEPPHWRLTADKLEAAITPRTKIIVLNTPMNPIGKVFDDEELAGLRDVVLKHGLTIVSDEVYEHLVFDGAHHRSPFFLPELRGRTVRIGSAGKTFSVTGWKVGYVTAEPHLLRPIARAHQFITFTTPPALQAAVSVGLALPDSYFDGLKKGLAERRDLLVSGLRAVGFAVDPAEATYFAVADRSDFAPEEDDLVFSRRLTLEAGVTPVPISSFYGKRDVTSHIRFCFAKRTETLTEAVRRLVAWRDGRGWKAAS